MAIYKVRIKTEGDKITYRTNATTLATVTYRPDLNKWDVSTPSVGMLAETKEDADKTARESITAFFASVGLSPDFINE